MVDFEVNYKAGHRLFLGETLYRLEDGHYQFKYPPFASLLYLPLSFFSLTKAKFIWFFLTALVTVALISLSAQLACHPKACPRYIPLLVFLILARFFIRELSLGQINALITTLLLLMVRNWLSAKNSSKKAFQTGFLWALASLLKPYSLIFFPLFLLRRCWQIIASAFIFLGLGFTLPVLFYGWKGNLIVHQEWLKSLRASTPPLLSSQDNISVFALLVKWFGRDFPVWSSGLVVIFLLAIILLLMIMKSKNLSEPLILEAASLLLLVPLVSPLGWDYTLISSSLALCFILYYWTSFPSFCRYFLSFILIITSLMIYDLLGRTIYSFLMKISLPTLLFFIVFAHLVFLRWIKKA
ncbi:MAG: DUF2029 domain-containing protein [Candidatus Aminicenantes bacterium]|nr:DUF2029 domain-containing protein [Candidatus Aminicenantes bacterium]